MLTVPGAPRIEGLVFRHFEDDSDFTAMALIGRRSFEADRIDFFETAEELANDCRETPESDPRSEVLMAEINGEPVAYSMIWSGPDESGGVVFWHIAHVVPEWRGTGLRLAMFRFSERTILSMAEKRGIRGPVRCKLWGLEDSNDWSDMVLAESYAPTLHFFEMVRPNLDHIPNIALPEGLELRPAKPEDYPKIWNASKEAFRGKPWFAEGQYDMKYFTAWLNSPAFMPDLWKVAWDGADIAGMARNHVSVEENLKFGRKRGHTQHLSVMPKWRGKGLGKALLAESLKLMRDQGLEEASLDVETQSTTGELELYLGMGYAIHRRYAHYAKQLAPV